MPEIIIYSTNYCPYCDFAIQLLRERHLNYTEIKIDEDPSEREAMLAKSGGRRTVPQIFIDGEHIGGFDDLQAFDQAKSLSERYPSGDE